eukprot:COSAG05_NODE_17888_length_317_cov_1.302752_1_plen_56_part_10
MVSKNRIKYARARAMRHSQTLRLHRGVGRVYQSRAACVYVRYCRNCAMGCGIPIWQ